MGRKGSALAVLLALLVAFLCFFAGQSSARSSIEFPSRIQGGGAGAEMEPATDGACKDCACPLTNGGGCTCYDTFTSCPSFCSGGNGCWCSDKFGCQCIKFIDQKWCGTKALKKPIGDALLPATE